MNSNKQCGMQKAGACGVILSPVLFPTHHYTFQDDTFWAVSDPASPQVGQYISMSELGELMKPRAETVAAVKQVRGGFAQCVCRSRNQQPPQLTLLLLLLLLFCHSGCQAMAWTASRTTCPHGSATSLW